MTLKIDIKKAAPPKAEKVSTKAAPTSVTWLPDDTEAQRILDEKREQDWFERRYALGKKSFRESGWPITFFDYLSPSRAKACLSRNLNNRVRGGSLLKRYVRAIQEGRWQLNGEALIVADTGELNDGQMRCLAVIQSGVSIPVLYVFGAARETRISIDTGGARTVGQMLGMNQFAYGNQLARAAHLAMSYERTGRFATQHADRKPDHQEILAWCNQNHEMVDDIKVGEQIARALGGVTSQMAGVVNLLSNVDEPDADRFFEKLKDGAGIVKGHPIHTLREKLLVVFRHKKSATDEVVAALTIKAWNAFRNNRDMRVLTWKSAEQFPVPV